MLSPMPVLSTPRSAAYHRMGRSLACALLGLLAVVGCAQQTNQTLDVRQTDIAPINTIAIATIAARPSVSQTLFSGHRGELVDMLGKFETELSNALVNQGFNVINVSQSGLIYNHDKLGYEIAYLHNTDDFMARARGEDEVHAEARRLHVAADALTGKRADRSTFLAPLDKIDQITSPNTRIFPEIGIDYRFNLPRYTENGGAMDNRFMSDAARAAIGGITREMGADAYMLLDANLLLSARKEGYILTGLTGGTRYVTLDGTAALVRNDGAILSVDWVRNQSVIPFGGSNPKPFTSERVMGVSGFHNGANKYNLQEASYQAIRFAALDIAKTYAAYRAEGMKALQEAKAARQGK
jgi:hypothetical protein